MRRLTIAFFPMLILPLLILPLLILIVMPIGPAWGDEVLFLNGDRLSGKIVKAASGKLTIKTEGAGEVTVDMSKVKTFSTDAPVQVGIKEQPPVSADVGAGPDRHVQTAPAPGAPPQPVAIADISAINPTLSAWTGSFSLNGLLTTGNSETEQLGFRGALSKRWPHDRLTFGAEYSYGRQEDPSTGEKSTTIDYAMALAKYDHFLTRKFYVYVGTKAERDKVAQLEVRVAPGAGVGYQWFERPTLNFYNELGLVWVYENYKNTGSSEFFGPRLAYAVDWTPIQPLKLFHKLEYIPSFEDLGGDYLLNIDAGARLTMWKGLFAELRYEFRYDATPASGRHRTDQRYILGAGWAF
jgi:uncharacterized protein DUF481